MSTAFSKLVAEAIPRYKSLARDYVQPSPVSVSSPWPETPFRLIHDTGAKSRTDIPQDHYCTKNAQIMAQTHNTIFRGLNAIYHQARQITPGTQDAEDFLLFCSVACEFIHCHHHAEESTYFPAIEEAAGAPGLMEGNIEQHRGFEEGLERLQKYAERTTKDEYDAEKLQRVIDELAGPLGTHLHEEIPSILDLHEKLDSKTLEKAYNKMHDVAANTGDKWRTGPFVFGCQDAEFLLDGEKITFPEVPVPLIVPYIMEHIISRRFTRAWRFCPSSAHGRIRPFTGRPADHGSGVAAGAVLRLLLAWAAALVMAMLLSAYVHTVS